ncbi:MAG: class I SAM-dependent methyltransferase [Gammaproteobacteria bacterium]
MPSLFDLPEPGQQAQAASRSLSELIRRRVDAAGGWLSFADYMELALYAPGLGYYSGGARVFGAAGDFVTAPELNADFAQAVARAIAPVLRDGDTILELGAGTGELAADLLCALKAMDGPAVSYQILERSGELRDRQAGRLSNFNVQWLDALPASGISGVILANEVLDALPVSCFQHTAAGLSERGVADGEAGFEWVLRPAGDELREQVSRCQLSAGSAWPADYRSEFCPSAAAWVRSLAELLERGLLLFFDYGLPAREYYHPDRRDGSLICHYRQRAHDDPFFWPGLQDITAWVDFTAVAAAGIDAGLQLAAYTTQAHFLLANGVLDETPDADPAQQARRASALRQLLLPGEMGEKFKLLAFSRGLAPEPLAVGRDMRHRL